MISEKKIAALQQEILSWYEKNKRDLPWRKTRNPYRILVSEVMLQQTQVSRVIPKYEAWFVAFPTVESLAAAKASDVLRLWSGLGYNRRALNLQKAAQKIVGEFSGNFPQDEKLLQTLPGIGEYTARAVLCFAFDKQVAVVDTNVRKVIAHIFYKGRLPKEKEIIAVAAQLLPKDQAYAWNQALMDYAGSVLKKEKIPVVRQSKFLGSRRYFRGQILKLLLRKQSLSIASLAKELKKEAVFIEEVVEELVSEGFITIKEDQVVLC